MFYKLALPPCSWIKSVQLDLFPQWLSAIQGSSSVLCVSLHLWAHTCVFLYFLEITRLKTGTQLKLAHVRICFNSVANGESNMTSVF